MAGAPGAGKSTLAVRWQESLGVGVAVHHSADPPPGTPRDCAPATWVQAFHRALARSLRSKTPVVIADATTLIPGHRAELAAMIARAGRSAHLVVLDVPPGLCRARVANRGSADRPPLPPARLEEYLDEAAAWQAALRAARHEAEGAWDQVLVLTDAHAARATLHVT